MGVPFLSMDVGCVDGEFFLIEFQALYFGTYTMEKAEKYFKKIQGEWCVTENNYSLEEIYTESVVSYIECLQEYASCHKEPDFCSDSKSVLQ